MSLINDNFGKVTINCMNDLVNNVKQRINDPNKNNIKTFMQLGGVLFPILS
jgi:nitrate reductase NapE component